MAVVILGCRAPNDVALPMMIRRVELGVKIYKDFQVSPVEHRNWKLILTGYKGSGQTLSEAAVMKVLALENGIDEENVLLEERARSTVENAYFTKLMIDELDINEIHVVSSEFHIPRSKVIFDTFFHEPTYTAHYHGALDSEQTKEERKKKEEYEMSMLHHNIHLCITDYGSRKKPLIFKSAMFSIEGLVHGFTSREGGVSRYKPLASLNLHFNPRRRDPKVCVRENYRRIAAAMELNVDAFHNPQAVHGRDIWVIGDSQPNSYDGIVTDRLGVVITAPGADCMPVLLCDPVRRVIGACHSGWRGTVLQIASHAVEIMKTRFGCNPTDIKVAVGPSIGPCCFEVDKDVEQQFDNAFVIRRPQRAKAHVDLWGCLYVSLQASGILAENLDVPQPWKKTQGQFTSTVTYCTMCDPDDRFFSHRRHGLQFGTQRGILMMK